MQYENRNAQGWKIWRFWWKIHSRKHLFQLLRNLKKNYQKIKNDKSFQKEFDYYLKNYAGRPTPLYFAENLTKFAGGAKIYLKREDLLHGGAHKINNTLGQALLAKKNEEKTNNC